MIPETSPPACAPKDSSWTPPGPGGVPKIRLEFRGQVIPNFKNSKEWTTKDPRGRLLERPFLRTNSNVRALMDQMSHSFESQLRFIIRTVLGATPTEAMRRPLIASLLPLDDCWTRIPETAIRAELCEPGQEGVVIEIERIN